MNRSWTDLHLPGARRTTQDHHVGTAEVAGVEFIETLIEIIDEVTVLAMRFHFLILACTSWSVSHGTALPSLRPRGH